MIRLYHGLTLNRRAFLQALAGVSLTGAVAATATAWGEDTHDVEITRIPVHLGLQTPLRLVVLGDIHFDPVCDEAYLLHVVGLVNSLQPDLLAYTGDFVSQRLGRLRDLAGLLAPAQGRLGTYTIPGNHELWTNVTYVQRVLDQRAGIRMLRNATIALPGQDDVYLTGFDSFSAGRPQPALLDQTATQSRHIVLAHEPDSFNLLTDSRIRLQVSGHTHGGQVRLPFYGALVLPLWGRDYQQGLYTRGTRQLYVNRGIGTYSLNLRINCRPEITVFELT